MTDRLTIESAFEMSDEELYGSLGAQLLILVTGKLFEAILEVIPGFDQDISDETTFEELGINEIQRKRILEAAVAKAEVSGLRVHGEEPDYDPRTIGSAVNYIFGANH